MTPGEYRYRSKPVWPLLLAIGCLVFLMVVVFFHNHDAGECERRGGVFVRAHMSWRGACVAGLPQ